MSHRVVVGIIALTWAGACTDKVLLSDFWDAGATVDVAADLPSVGSKDAESLPGGPDAICGFVSARYKSQVVQLVVMLDRSRDMLQISFSDYVSREFAAQSVLSYKMVPQYQASINLGLENFPVDPLDPNCQAYGCCAGGVTVQPSPTNGDAMNTGIWCSPSGPPSCPNSVIQDSPWHLALSQVADYFRKKNFDGDANRYVLLITSGEPTCSGDSKPSSPCDSALNAANDLVTNFAQRLYIVSVGYPLDKYSCLTRIGQTMSTASVFAAMDKADLNDDLNQVFSEVAQDACTVTSSQFVPNEVTLNVKINGNTVPQGDPSIQNGWYFSGPERTRITFVGQACSDYLAARAQSRGASDAAYFSYWACAPTRDDAGQGGPKP